jgi:hypothetical protein
MSPAYDQRIAQQVDAAIKRAAEREFPEVPNELVRVATVAMGLAIAAVQALAEERSTSVEAVLNELLREGL